MQHARASRIRAACPTAPDVRPDWSLLVEPQARGLAVLLAKFNDEVVQSTRDYQPATLATYLIKLGRRYASFYDACPVLTADSTAVRDARAALNTAAATVLRHGLALLGIEAPERM